METHSVCVCVCVYVCDAYECGVRLRATRCAVNGLKPREKMLELSPHPRCVWCFFVCVSRVASSKVTFAGKM